MNAGKTAVTAHGGIDWNASGGSADSNDLTFARALFARFGGERINQITVTDSRSDAAGGQRVNVHDMEGTTWREKTRTRHAFGSYPLLQSLLDIAVNGSGRRFAK